MGRAMTTYSFLVERLDISFVLCVSKMYFFTPIPCTYTSSPLDCMAENCFIFCMDTKDHAIHHSFLLIPEERKKHFV